METSKTTDFHLVRSPSARSVRSLEIKKLGPEEAKRLALKEFEDSRNSAMHHTQLKAECYTKAKDAIQRSDTSVALYYSHVANLHKDKIDMYNHKAANCIMEVHNLTQKNPERFVVNSKSVQNFHLAILHLDFAENFKCVSQDEVQSAHYNQRQKEKREKKKEKELAKVLCGMAVTPQTSGIISDVGISSPGSGRDSDSSIVPKLTLKLGTSPRPETPDSHRKITIKPLKKELNNSIMDIDDHSINIVSEQNKPV